MAGGRSSNIFKNGTSFAFLVAFCVLNFVYRVNCITVVDKSESKTKREGVDGTLIGTYKKNEVKPFYPNKASSSNFGEVQQKDKGIKDRVTIYNTKVKDNTPAGSGYEDREKEYGLYAPEEQAYQGYGYQDFDQTSHYGPPQPSGFSGDRGGYPYSDHGFKDHKEEYHGFKDHKEEYPGFGVPQFRPDPHFIALKGILIPLAGVALLGAAAALVTNPILLQLGVISGAYGGKRRRRSMNEDGEGNLDAKLKGLHDLEYKGLSIVDLIKNAKIEHAEAENAKDGSQFERYRSKRDTNNGDRKVEGFAKVIANDKDNVANKNRYKRSGDTRNADPIENNHFDSSLPGIDIRAGKLKDKFAGVNVASSNVNDNANNDYDDVKHEQVRFVDTL